MHHLQAFKHNSLFSARLDQILDRGEIFGLLEDVLHEDGEELAPRRLLLLELVRRAVADRRVAEDRPRAHLHVVVQFLLLLHEVLAEARLLLFARLQVGEVYPEVKLGQLVLSPHLDPIQLARIVAELLLDLLHGYPNMSFRGIVVAILVAGFAREAVGHERLRALALGLLAAVLVLVLRLALELDAFARGGRFCRSLPLGNS